MLSLSYGAKLIERVLQIELCCLHRVDNLFTDLRVNWNPLDLCLINKFALLLEVERAKALRILRNEHELASEPLCDFFV